MFLIPLCFCEDSEAKEGSLLPMAAIKNGKIDFWKDLLTY